jgi:PAS domain S-box-containing protein
MTFHFIQPDSQADSAELLRALTQVSHAVSNAVSLDQILHLASEQAAVLLGAERSLVLLTDDAGGLRIRAQHGLDDPPAESFTGPLDERLLSRLALVLGTTALESVLAVPLVVRGHVTGLVAVGLPPGVGPSGPCEAILTALADQMAAPLENARLAEEVRQAQLLAESALRAAGVGTFDRELSTDQPIFSVETYRLHGIPPGTPLKTETWLAVVHPEDRARMQARAAGWKNVMSAAGVPPTELVESEYRVVLPDGAVRWLGSRVRGVFGEDGRAARLLGIVFDITERKRVEAALRETEERFRLATEVLAGFLYDWDPATNHVERFGGMEEVLGFRLEEVPPTAAWFEFRVHPDDLPRAREAARAAFESGAPGYSHVYRCLHRDGHYVHVADRGRFVRDEAGRVVRVLGGINDISERWRLEGERAALLDREREARAAAEAATRARDDVLGIVSHDLQTPLSTIAICASALSESVEPPPESVHEVVDVIHRCTAWMHRLIRDLLDVASMQAGRFALQRRDEAPAALLAEAAAMFAPAARDRGIALETQTASNLPPVLADAERVLQGLANLVTNALQSTEPGGRITLRAERGLDGVRFAVEDTGAGIAPEDLPHVFDRFWQRRDGRGERGTGLGLAIVRGIVHAHGGELTVESTPGRGSQFRFTIPTR